MISLQEITGNVSSLKTTGFRFVSESVSSRLELRILAEEEKNLSHTTMIFVVTLTTYTI
jgi:hypothetical protein